MAARHTTNSHEGRTEMNMWEVCKDWCRDAERNGQGHMVPLLILGYWKGEARRARRELAELRKQIDER